MLEQRNGPMRRHLVFSSLILSLFVFAGCSADDAAAPVTSTLPQTDTATDSIDGGNCKAYVAAVRQLCLDSITRDLDMSCTNQLIALDVVQGQVAGTLFDVGSDAKNAQVAESACASFLKSLQKKRQSKDAGMHAESDAGPKCKALAENFDATCLRDLGQQPLSDKCGNVARMLSGVARLPAEDRCAMAEYQLK